METVILQAIRRERLGTKYARRTRQQGNIPAIIYGHGETPEPVTLQEHDVELALLHHSRLIDVDLEGRKESLLIKAVQFDHLGTTPIHLDLIRVAMDERVRVEVEIELRGEPAGVHDGGILHQSINSVEVECLVTAIPESLRPSVVHLGLGDSLLVKDIEVPPGVSILHKADDRVAICAAPTAEIEEEEAVVPEGEQAEGAAQPEVIGRAKAEQESAEK